MKKGVFFFFSGTKPPAPLHRTSPSFNDPERKDFQKHSGERRNACPPTCSPFIPTFSTPLYTISIIRIIYIEREYVYIQLPYIKKMSNEVGGIDNLRAMRRKLSFLPTELDIFYIWQHYVRILFIFQHPICWVLLLLTPINMNLAEYGKWLAVLMTS